MSDYISGLRSDLVEAAARHQRRGSLSRTALPVLPRAWSRPALAAALATAACVAAIAVAVSTVGAPTPAPTEPHRVTVVRLGLEGFDAAYAAGWLWVAGANGEVVQVDAEHHRVVNRVKAGQLAESIAADRESVWVTVTAPGMFSSADALSNSSLVRIGARTGSIERRIPFHVEGMGPVALGAGGVWLVPNGAQAAEQLLRLDPATGRRLAAVRSDFRKSLAADDQALWALRERDGAVAQIDPARNRIVSVVPGVWEAHNESGSLSSALAPDGDGVWVAGGSRGDVAFVQAGRVVRRIRVGEGIVDAVARTRDALWASLQQRGLDSRSRVVRIDPETGRPTGTVDLGHRQPTALAPAGRGLWIVTLDGTATLIR
jgi:hypothetical protein